MGQIRPPRGLWTSFQLGRPLGEPNDTAFQHRVLLQALGLLERRDGPVILEDFSDDPPNWSDTPGWPAPALPAIETPETATGWEAELTREITASHPTWQRACARFGRTTVGLSGQAPELWPAFATRFFAGEMPTVPPHATAALALRFLCDDIKAMYSEAAQAYGTPHPVGRSTRNRRQSLIALRSKALQSENNALKTVSGRFFVPVPFLPPD